MPPAPEPVYLESGKRRVFACSLNWPGWARSARDEQAALSALADYANRYALVAAGGGIPFSATGDATFEVVERLPGNATTDFGAPGAIPAADRVSLAAAEASRLAALVDAAWKYLDNVIATAPAELRKGPRGGGRDRDKIAAHVLGAEVEYARKLGLRLKAPAHDDQPAITAFRETILTAFSLGSTDRRIEESKNPPWPLPYAARRIAWHTLDHAWEIEDRS